MRLFRQNVHLKGLLAMSTSAICAGTCSTNLQAVANNTTVTYEFAEAVTFVQVKLLAESSSSCYRLLKYSTFRI